MYEACIFNFDETHILVLTTDLDSTSQDKANDTTPEISSAVLHTTILPYTAISLAEWYSTACIVTTSISDAVLRYHVLLVDPRHTLVLLLMC